VVNCGKPLRDSYTKYRSDIDMARSNFQGIVKSKNIGKSAAKRLNIVY
jgi:hypothetical protein